MEYYSATKKNKITPSAVLVALEIIRGSEVSQKEKDKYHITCMWNLKYDAHELF